MTKTARTSVIFSVFGLLFAGLCLKYYFTSAKLAIPPIYLGTSYLVCSFPSLHLLSLSVVGFFSFGTATIKLALVNFLIRLSVLAVVFITAIVVRLIVKLANSNALRNINRFAGVLIILMLSGLVVANYLYPSASLYMSNMFDEGALGQVNVEEAKAVTTGSVPEEENTPGGQEVNYTMSYFGSDFGHKISDFFLNAEQKDTRAKRIKKGAGLTGEDMEAKGAYAFSKAGDILTSDAPPVVANFGGLYMVIMCLAMLFLGFNAIHFFKNVIDNPRAVDAIVYNGMVFSEKGMLDDAIREFNKVIEIRSGHVDALYNRGYAFYLKKQYDRAVSDMTSVISLAPENPRAYFYRAEAYIQMNLYKSAIPDLTKVIELSLNNLDAYYNRGYCYYLTGAYESSIFDFTRALAIDPKFVNAYQNRGNAYFRKKMYDEAIADWTRSAELSPNNAVTYFNRGNAYYLMGQDALAMSDFDHAIQLDPVYKDAFFSKAELCAGLGRTDEAIAAYENFIKLCTDHEDPVVGQVKAKIEELIKWKA